MKIEILDRPDGEIIARELNVDSFVGDFVCVNDGSILYRPPTGAAPVYVSPDLATFTACVHAWNAYVDSVARLDSEVEQLTEVERLRSKLTALGQLPGAPESFWPLLMEQADCGML